MTDTQSKTINLVLWRVPKPASSKGNSQPNYAREAFARLRLLPAPLPAPLLSLGHSPCCRRPPPALRVPTTAFPSLLPFCVPAVVVHRKPTGLDYPLVEALGLPSLLPLGSDVRCMLAWLAGNATLCLPGLLPAYCSSSRRADLPPCLHLLLLLSCTTQVANGGKAAEKVLMERVLTALAPMRAAPAEGAPAPPVPTPKKARVGWLPGHLF